MRSVVARASFQPPFGRLTSTLRTGFSATKLLTTSSKVCQRSITYDNITNCDIKTPFFSEGKCINCEPKLPIFDLYRGRCVRCSNGFVFDGAKRACVVGAAGEVKKCPKGTYFDAKSSSCVRVITCSGNQFFNGTSRLCQDYATCDGKWLNKQTNECVDFATCEDGKWLDKNNNECIALLTCPRDSP